MASAPNSHAGMRSLRPTRLTSAPSFGEEIVTMSPSVWVTFIGTHAEYAKIDPGIHKTDHGKTDRLDQNRAIDLPEAA